MSPCYKQLGCVIHSQAHCDQELIWALGHPVNVKWVFVLTMAPPGRKTGMHLLRLRFFTVVFSQVLFRCILLCKLLMFGMGYRNFGMDTARGAQLSRCLRAGHRRGNGIVLETELT